MAVEIGSTVAGYRLLACIGRGGMGEVFTAEHPRLPRIDAVKVLHPALGSDPVFRARFEREADLVARLSHPAIVAVFDRGVADDRLWIAMEYVDGADASALITDRGVHPLLAIAIVTTVAAALDHAHRNGVLHRDVKPENVLIRPGGDPLLPDAVKLTDFGIARVRDEVTGLTGAGTTIGTLAYTPPEQIEGGELDPRSDQYALACTAFELLSGAPPFTAETQQSLVKAQLLDRPPAVTSRNPALPSPVDDVLRRALAKRSADRFVDCGQFAGALDAAVRGRLSGGLPAAPPTPVVQRPVPPATGRARRRRLPSRLVVAGVVAVAVLVGLGIAVGATTAPRPPDAALATPATPRVQVTPTSIEIGWDRVNGATHYLVRQGDTTVYIGSGDHWSMPRPVPGEYAFSVVAVSGDRTTSAVGPASAAVQVTTVWGELQPLVDLFPTVLPSTPVSTDAFDGMVCSGLVGSQLVGNPVQVQIFCTGPSGYQLTLGMYPTAGQRDSYYRQRFAGERTRPMATSGGHPGRVYTAESAPGTGSVTLLYDDGVRARVAAEVSTAGRPATAARSVLDRLPL